MSSHVICIRMAKIKRRTRANAVRLCRAQITHTLLVGNTQSWQFLIKLSTQSPHNQAVAQFCTYPSKIKTQSHTKPVDKCPKQLYSKCPQTKNNPQALQRMGGYVNLDTPSHRTLLNNEKRELLIHTRTWMSLKGIMPSEKS